jgi:uncharacterized membrane protein YfcA
MTLELFTATGALVGALIAFAIPDRVLAGLFAALMLWVAGSMLRSLRPRAGVVGPGGSSGAVGPGADGPSPGPAPGRSLVLARLSGPGYRVRNLGPGVVGSVFAGVVSALLGVGGGIVKVPLMHLVMGVPLRVATATSNLMIGVTASSSAIIYLIRGGIDPYVAGPTVLGVFLGATVGSRTAHRIDTRVLRVLFIAVLLYTAGQMIGRAFR